MCKLSKVAYKAVAYKAAYFSGVRGSMCCPCVVGYAHREPPGTGGTPPPTPSDQRQGMLLGFFVVPSLARTHVESRVYHMLTSMKRILCRLVYHMLTSVQRILCRLVRASGAHPGIVQVLSQVLSLHARTCCRKRRHSSAKIKAHKHGGLVSCYSLAS